MRESQYTDLSKRSDNSERLNIKRIGENLSDFEEFLKENTPDVVLIPIREIGEHEEKIKKLKNTHGFKIIAEKFFSRADKLDFTRTKDRLYVKDFDFDAWFEAKKTCLEAFPFVDSITPSWELEMEVDDTGVYFDALYKAHTNLRFTSKPKQTVQSQLERLFPNAEGLEKIVDLVDSEFNKLSKVTDQTYTGAVFSFEIDGKRVYCKAGTDKIMLAKEAQYAKDAWTHPLMRAITPQLAGLVESDSISAVLTYDTRNPIISTIDELRYLELKKGLVHQYAKRKNVNPSLIERNPFMTDMFNRALAHTLMKEHMDDPIYSSASLPSVSGIEVLENRLIKSPFDIRGIKRFFPLYRFIAEEAMHYDKNPTMLGHYDTRLENIFPGNHRITGDFGTVKPGTPEFDLGKMETSHTKHYVDAYCFFRNSIEQMQGNNFEFSGKDIQELQRKTKNIAFLNSVKLACFKMSRGIDPGHYIDLSRNYFKAAEFQTCA